MPEKKYISKIDIVFASVINVLILKGLSSKDIVAQITHFLGDQ